MEPAIGQNAAMLRILYSTAATALDKLRPDPTVSATLIADLEGDIPKRWPRPHPGRERIKR